MRTVFFYLIYKLNFILSSLFMKIYLVIYYYLVFYIVYKTFKKYIILALKLEKVKLICIKNNKW